LKPATNPTALRVQQTLGEGFRVLEFDQPTRTAAEAAAAIGCTVAQIAKSIVFKAASGRAIVVVASGAHRVSEAKVAALVGEPIGRADAAFVRAQTGYAIGGIPPVGHATPLTTFIDRDLEALGDLWAAGGTPNSVFKVAFADLLRLTGGAAADVAEVAPSA
jgi:prolyl-tRNA editing enzyme YbaK/EbsC (Cys-tRNA(Pro) deacylase)